MKFAKVAVEAANYSFDSEFDYIVPPEIENEARAGKRVTVPFGNGNKKSVGMIFEITSESQGKRLKKIISVDDEKPVLSEEMLRLALFMKDRCFCTLYDCVKAMLPSGLGRKIVNSYALSPDVTGEQIDALEANAREFCRFLEERGTFVREDLVFKNLSIKADKSIPSALIKKGYILSQSDSVRRLGDVTSRMVRLLPGWEEVRLTQKQKETALVLRDAGAATVSELCYFTGNSPAVANALVKNGAAEFFETAVDYYSALSDGEGERKEISLTSEQQAAFDELRAKEAPIFSTA